MKLTRTKRDLKLF